MAPPAMAAELFLWILWSCEHSDYLECDYIVSLASLKHCVSLPSFLPCMGELNRPDPGPAGLDQLMRINWKMFSQAAHLSWFQLCWVSLVLHLTFSLCD